MNQKGNLNEAASSEFYDTVPGDKYDYQMPLLLGHRVLIPSTW